MLKDKFDKLVDIFKVMNGELYNVEIIANGTLIEEDYGLEHFDMDFSVTVNYKCLMIRFDKNDMPIDEVVKGSFEISRYDMMGFKSEFETALYIEGMIDNEMKNWTFSEEE